MAGLGLGGWKLCDAGLPLPCPVVEKVRLIDDLVRFRGRGGGRPAAAQVTERGGGPGGVRTHDQRIMSPLL